MPFGKSHVDPSLHSGVLAGWPLLAGGSSRVLPCVGGRGWGCPSGGPSWACPGDFAGLV